MVIPAILQHTNGTPVPSSAMIDSGASTQFLDLDSAVKHNLPLDLKHKPETLIVLDGREATNRLTHTYIMTLTIDQHLETLPFQVTKLAGWDMILGKTWLKKHNPVIDWTWNTITCSSGYCQANCLPTRSSISTHIPTTNYHISLITWAAFQYAIRYRSPVIFILAMSTIIEPSVNPAKHPNYPSNLIPAQYNDLLPLFAKKGADKLLPHRYVDHEIPIRDNKPPIGRMYSMSASELQDIWACIDDNLSKGFIRAFSSSCASPILFVKTKDGSLRLCIYYRALNNITTKDRYLLPCIEETLNQIRGAKYFTQLDLRSAYNLIRIKEGDEWKTAFRTQYGLYKFLVRPFGLTNAPATCQRFVNNILQEFLDVFYICYLDDIFLYSENLKNHH